MRPPVPGMAGAALLCLLLCAGFGPAPAGAQEVGAAAASESESPMSPLDENAVIDMDIRTSTLLELADWCRRLGLSDAGTRDELASRLRERYGISAPEQTEDSSSDRFIVIESARSTDYFTLEAVNEEYARLQGDVIVSLKEGDTVHRLKARELLFNRTRNLLSASGGVEYVKEGAGTVETFRGESLTIDMDDWTGVFLDGASERSLEKEETAYRFSGTLISRDKEEVTVLTQAVVTNAKAKEAYWSINASKLWLLPGSEWAVFNAVLKVGEIPVLYIPFFYLPGDELVFHPVLGYRSREGSFLQTTTYILGRPKASSSSESSISNILGSGEDMERERQGMFLRSTGTRRKDEEKPSLSLLFDAYTNLGAYAGVEASIPKTGILGKTDISFGLGLTRNVYQVSSDYYTPFAQFDGTSDWNEGRFFNALLPLRYRFKTTGGLTAEGVSASWNFPFYSDPFVDKDFMNRSEDMDWFNMVKGGAALEDAAGDAVGVLGTYEWRVSGSATPSLPKLAPYLGAVTLSNLSSSLTFGTRASLLYGNSVSPDRSFFYPDRFTVFSLSGSLAGRPYSYGEAASSPASSPAAAPTTDGQDAGGLEPRSPWPQGEDEAPLSSSRAAMELVPPALSQRFETASSGAPVKLSLDYRLTPSAASDMQFRSSQTNWPEVDDIDWGERSSVLTTLRNEGSLSSTLSLAQDRLSTVLKLNGSTAWQRYTYLNEEAEEFDTDAERDAALLRTYNATFFSLSPELNITAKPFIGDPAWGATNLQYALKGLLAKSAFDGTAEDPSWEVLYGEWRKEDVDTHRVSLNLVALVRDKQQNLTLSADLPPEEALVSGNTAVRIWRTISTASASVLDPFGTPFYKPVTFTETLEFGTKRNAKQEVIWDPELEELTSLVSSLSFGGLTASYSAAYAGSYTLDDQQGWRLTTEPEQLRPKALSIAYAGSRKSDVLWRNRIGYTLDVASSLSLDLQRYTYSTFYLTLGSTFKVFEFLDLSVNVKSQNAVVFRYLQDLPFWDEPVELPGERNPLKDLADSFRFDDDELRQNSGFKLKSFGLKATHYMGDWTADLGVDLVPYLDKEVMPFRYRFNTQVSFLVKWIPISEVKAETYRDKDGFLFK